MTRRGHEFDETELVLQVIHTIHQAMTHHRSYPIPATPAKAGAHGKSGSRPSPGKRGGDVELVVSTKWRDSGGLFLVAPAKAGAQGLPALCPPPWMPAFAGTTVRWVNAER